MDSISNEYLTNTILKGCFPQASGIQLVECKKIENLFNVSSDIIRLTVEFQERGTTQNKKLILKIPFTNTAFRSYCTEYGLFYKEKQMYEVMIPLLNKIPTVSKILPVHYLTIDTGTVVIEDLAVQGYKVAGRQKFFDFKQSRHTLKAMAEFHAATFKVHRENPHLLQDPMFGRNMAIDARLDFIITWHPVICELFKRKNAANMVSKFDAAVELLKKEDKAVYAKVNPAHFKIVLLNHGDLRNDNIMLKQNKNDEIEDVKFIDFQMSWWTTPAFDFLFYLTFSLPIQVIDKQFDDLVDAYWQYFSEALLQLQCPFDHEKTDFLRDIEKLQFMFVIWLFAWCSFNCPLEPDVIRRTFKHDDTETFKLYCECLDDEQFTQSLWGWLQYCEKINIFDAMGNEAMKED